MPRIRQLGCTDIIARFTDQAFARAILGTNVPTIALGLQDEPMLASNLLSKLSEVSSNAEDIARLAAEHLLDRGPENFAFVGSADRAWSKRREAAFYNFLVAWGYQPHIYRQPRRPANRAWEMEQDFLARWIADLSSSVGIFACDDDRGREILISCTLARRRVPEEVAVVGVDNDELICELSQPPLSSVSLNAFGAGYNAAKLLYGLMKKKICKARRVPIEATRVVTRRSSDIVAIDDADVVNAI